MPYTGPISTGCHFLERGLFIPNPKNRWELIQQQRLPEYRRGQTNKMLNRFHKPCFDTALNT